MKEKKYLFGMDMIGKHNLIKHFTSAYALAAAMLFSFSSCSQHEEVSFDELSTPRQMEFTAQMCDESVTKTVLDGSGTASDRRIYWMPLDSIKLSSGGAFTRFVYRGETRTAKATFKGSIAEGEMYYAVYPASSSVAMSSGVLNITLPTTQQYVAESFDNGAYPMVAKSTNTQLEFRNLCGALVLNLKGSVTVSRISFEAVDASSVAMPVAGTATVNMNNADTPTLTMASGGATKVVLDCGNGVPLNTSTAVPFYIALPPATYSSFTLNIYTTDSRLMTKTASNLKIVRSRGASTSPLTFAENSGAVDLSATGTANCYIVTRAGNFSFDATVIGNGEPGLLPQYSQDEKKFHTTTASISPVSAKVLWEDVDGLVSNVACSDGKISFTTSSEKGNALIAAYSGADGSGDILWSWHIWCTDMPKNEEYRNHINKSFVVLDRNLGATAADPASGVEATYGLHYQWGRKDPFSRNDAQVTIDATSSTKGTIENTIKHPDVFYTAGEASWYDWYYGSGSGDQNRNNYLWGHPFGYNTNYTASKSIYDPCPQGYMLAPNDTWTRFTANGEKTTTPSEFNVSGSFDKGWHFFTQTDKTGYTSWYSAAGYRNSYDGSLSYEGDYGCYWFSSSTIICYQGAMGFSSGRVNPLSSGSRACGFSLRCVREENFINSNISAPIVYTSDPSVVSLSTARAGGEVTSDGGADVTARGVCWSTSPTPTLSDSRTEDGTGTGSFTSEMTGLTQGTTYYVRAYATSQVGTNYGNELSFKTIGFPDKFIYFRGGFNGWGNTREELRHRIYCFDEDDNTYRGTVFFGLNMEEHLRAGFKIADKDWKDFNFGADATGTYENDAPVSKLISGSLSNNIMNYPTYKYYSFELNISNLTLSKEYGFNQMGLVGVNGDWGNEVVMDYNPNLNRFYVDIDAAAAFQGKFRLDGVWDNYWGVGGVKGGDDIDFPAGQYRVYFYFGDYKKPLLEVNPDMYGKEEPCFPDLEPPVQPSFVKETVPGMYGPNGSVMNLLYTKYEDQLSSLKEKEKRSFRILNYSKQLYFTINDLPIEISEGDSFDVTLFQNWLKIDDNMVIPVQVIKKEDGMCWLYNVEQELGFIIIIQ